MSRRRSRILLLAAGSNRTSTMNESSSGGSTHGVRVRTVVSQLVDNTARRQSAQPPFYASYTPLHSMPFLIEPGYFSSRRALHVASAVAVVEMAGTPALPSAHSTEPTLVAVPGSTPDALSTWALATDRAFAHTTPSLRCPKRERGCRRSDRRVSRRVAVEATGAVGVRRATRWSRGRRGRTASVSRRRCGTPTHAPSPRR